MRNLCSIPEGNGNHAQELQDEAVSGDTGSFSIASSICDSLDMNSMSSEASQPESGYCRLAWRAEMTPGAVSTADCDDVL